MKPSTLPKPNSVLIHPPTTAPTIPQQNSHKESTTIFTWHDPLLPEYRQ
ncbi:hypothetical protein KZ773_01295 [Escherichia coli]|nr:hypothetical protein [Escherichia coli]